MSVRSLNWLKFGGLVGLAFVLGLLFAGLLDLPTTSAAQTRAGLSGTVVPAVQTTVPPAATQPLTALSDAFATVAEGVKPSVVYIRSRRTERPTASRRVPPGFEEFFGRPRRNQGEPQVETGAGSGFLVTADGYILTNYHVVEDADEVMVRLADRHEFKAKIVGSDQNTDLAVVKIEPQSVHLTPARLGSSDATRVGEWVLAVGNPLQEELNFTVTSGIVSAKGRGQLPLPNSGGTTIQDFIQTDAAINRGNFGGPLLNVRGEVIGINSAIFSQTGFNVGYAFAIPIDLAKQVMEQLIAKGKVERAALGVLVSDATQLDADYVKLAEIRGVKVNEFTPGSPAQAAGLEPGDIIITVDGAPVEYTAQLQQVVGFKRPGSIAKVEVARKDGVRKVFNVRLVEQGETAQLAQRNEDDTPNEPTNDDAGEIKNRLGIGVETLTPDLIREITASMQSSSSAISRTRGVLVDDVDPYGPADGLLFTPSQRINIITAVEGKPIRSESELRAALKQFKAGDIVTLSVFQPQAGSGQGGTSVVRVKLAG